MFNKPIRIVPTYKPKKIAAPVATPPNFTYRNGTLLNTVKVFSVFWGNPWLQSPLNNDIQTINQFFTFILSSPLIDQLKEYSVPGYTIDYGQFIGSATVTQPDVFPFVFGHTLEFDFLIQNMLQQGIASNSLPQPDAETLYFVYLPPGVFLIQSLIGFSCITLCGYHNDINGQIFYAVVPYPDCPGCMANFSLFDAITTISSHELCEAITDPVPGLGWYDNANGEIGDTCAFNTKQIGSYTVQREWSKNANACA